MEYENFIFKGITYKNGPERDPYLKLKYRAESLDDGTPKDAKDKFDELPQKGFRKVWDRLLEFWRMNMEHVLGSITWDTRSSRVQKVKIKWESGDPVAVKYVAKVATGFDETEKLPTPYVQPSMTEGELDAIKDLCEYAERYLHGERDQQDIFDDTQGDPQGVPSEDPEPESFDTEDESSADLSDVF